MIHPCDRRTDVRAIAYTRYSIYIHLYIKPRKNCVASTAVGLQGVTYRVSAAFMQAHVYTLVVGIFSQRGGLVSCSVAMVGVKCV